MAAVSQSQSKGRCAGCGAEGTIKRVAQHTVTCEKFAELFRKDPALALDPASAFRAYRAEDAQEERFDAKVAKRASIKDRLQGVASDREAAQQARWTGGVVNHKAGQVPAPEDGVLVNRGRSQAQQDVLEKLAGAPPA
jgi:hypothetical protein